MANVARASAHVNAAPSVVWRAITDPDLVARYFFGTRLETDWQPGSSIVYRGEWNGAPYEDLGTVVSIDEPRSLVTTYFSPSSGLPDEPENRQTVSYELVEEDGGTRVTITQDNNRDAEGAEHATANWRMVLDGLARTAEELPPSE